MDKNVEEMTEGQSCLVDGSCCGGNNIQEELMDKASCSLDPAEDPDRARRWKVLFGQVISHRMTDAEAYFDFPQTDEIASELDELIKLERVCCANVAWAVKETSEGLHLTLKAGGGGLAALVRGFMPDEASTILVDGTP